MSFARTELLSVTLKRQKRQLWEVVSSPFTEVFKLDYGGGGVCSRWGGIRRR